MYSIGRLSGGHERHRLRKDNVECIYCGVGKLLVNCERTDSSKLIQTMKEVENTAVPSYWLGNLLARFGVIGSSSFFNIIWPLWRMAMHCFCNFNVLWLGTPCLQSAFLILTLYSLFLYVSYYNIGVLDAFLQFTYWVCLVWTDSTVFFNFAYWRRYVDNCKHIQYAIKTLPFLSCSMILKCLPDSCSVFLVMTKTNYFHFTLDCIWNGSFNQDLSRRLVLYGLYTFIW